MRLLVISFVILSAIAANAQSTRSLESFEIGLNAIERGDNAAALAEFTVTLAQIEREGASDRFFSKVHYNLGVSYYRLRQLEKAASEYEKAERFAQGSYERASYALGLARSELRDWPAAEKAFKRAVIQNNRNGETWFDLGFVYVSTGKNDKAIHAFKQAVKFGTGQTAICHNNIGVLLAMAGRTIDAEAEFRKAIEVSGGELKEAKENLVNLEDPERRQTRGLEIATRRVTRDTIKSL